MAVIDFLDCYAYYITALASLLLYINAGRCGFVFDDLPAIKSNKDLDPESPWINLLWNDYWGMPMSKEESHKSYRPLTVMTFKLNTMIFGKEPWSFHFVNIILHTAVCLLYLRTCRLITNICFKHGITKKTGEKGRSRNEKAIKLQYTDSRLKCQYIPLIATALFVVHPIHCEAVTGVVGRAEILSGLFMLLTFLSYSKLTAKSLVLSCIFCVCAVASKEQGITIVAVCVAFDFFIAHRLTPTDLLLFRNIPNLYTGLRVAILSFVACLAMLWRFIIMEGGLPIFTPFDNPAAMSSTPKRQLTYNFLLVKNVWLLLNPGNLLCDWSMGTVPLVAKLSDIRNLATLIFWTVFLALSYIAASKTVSTAKIILVSLALLVFPFLPASNLLFPVGFVIAERVLYVPSMGFCLLVSLGIVRLLDFEKFKNFIFGIFFVIIFCFSAKTILRNFEWESDYTLFKSGLSVTNNNAKIWNNIGHTFEDNAQETALKYFQKAAGVQPNDIGSHMNVGRMLKQLNLFKESEFSYRKARDLVPKKRSEKTAFYRIAPSHLQLYVQLGNIIKLDKTRLAEVDELYKEVISLRKNFIEAYINRGEILILLGRNDEAIKCYQDALEQTDDKADVHFNLGVVHSQTGNISGAVEHYTYAIQENPNHIKALYNSAVIFQETGNPDLIERAKVRVKRVLKLEPDNFLALSLLGSIYLDKGDEKGAVSLWRKVLEIQPEDKSALYNMAFMYSKIDNKLDECLKSIEALLKFHPEYIKGLMLYGDVLLNKGHDTEAARQAFQRIVNVDRNHIQARHNLCVVTLEEGKLYEAEECMKEVYIMAPDAKYVADNLAIIRKHIAKKKKEEPDIGVQFTKESSTKTSIGATNEKHSIDTPAKDDDDVDEVIIEPVRKKSSKLKSYSERAKIILAEAQEAVNSENSDPSQKLENLESSLKKIHLAVEKLSTINDEVTKDLSLKCPAKVQENSEDIGVVSSEKVETTRKKALDMLDKLEAELGL